MSDPAQIQRWTQHIAWAQASAQALTSAPGQVLTPLAIHPPATEAALTDAEATRVQRYRDRLMIALRARDRMGLAQAKQQVLDAAFRPLAALGERGDVGGTADSPALRRALRDLSWRMAGVLLPRRPGL